MKNLKLFPILLSFLCMTSLFTSCKKDNDLQPREEVETSDLVGQWDVIGGEAVVYLEGEKVYTGPVRTTGTMTFNNNKTGKANFEMQVLDLQEAMIGDFTWIKEGFEVVVDKGTEDEVRWAILTNEKDRKSFQLTVKDEEEDSEVEFSLNMIRK